MVPLALFCCTVLFLFLSVPWFFLGAEPDADATGLPGWFIYGCVAGMLFAVYLAASLGVFWDRLAGGEPGEAGKEGEDAGA